MRHRRARCGAFIILLLFMFQIAKWRYGEVIFGKPVEFKSVPDERTLFPFDYTKIKNCGDMYKNDKDRDIQISKVRESMEILNKEALKYSPSIQGNVGWKPIQALFFLTVANASFINTICETGFNAGHSSYLWLTGNTKAQVYTFSLGSEEYNKPMFEFLDKLFPGRLHAIWGDSRKTIPAFTKRNPELKCDLIYIDGGHGYSAFSADLRNLHVHANKDYHIVIADDFLMNGVNKAWMEKKEQGQLKEHFHCSTHVKVQLSMVVGKYTFNNHSTLNTWAGVNKMSTL